MRKTFEQTEAILKRKNSRAYADLKLARKITKAREASDSELTIEFLMGHDIALADFIARKHNLDAEVVLDTIQN